MKKIIVIVISSLVCFLSMNFNVFAVSTIPDKMPAGTLIKYVSHTEYIVLDGEDKEKNLYDENIHIEPISNTFENKLNENEIYVETYPNPCKGMIVQYGSDGYVNKIYALKGIKMYCNIKVEESTTIQITSQEKSAENFPTYRLISTWGDYPNRLYKGVKDYTYLYYGNGRATTFSDNVGQNNHVLVKGDIATSLQYDNCAYNKKVEVSMPKKDGTKMTRTMYKRDAGGMPNAIVDIWKTGVEYWGYTYNSNLSINDATIWHN